MVFHEPVDGVLGLAAVASEVFPLQRSYWVVLTVAIVVKPDNGSVFARALQRGIGTIVGVVLGAVILAAVPYGPWLLFPMAVLAAGLPYGRLRTFGLMATFMTPLIVLLIDSWRPPAGGSPKNGWSTRCSAARSCCSSGTRRGRAAGTATCHGSSPLRCATSAGSWRRRSSRIGSGGPRPRRAAAS